MLYSSIDSTPIQLLHHDNVDDGEVGCFLDPSGRVYEYACLKADSSLTYFESPKLKTELDNFLEGALPSFSRSDSAFIFGALSVHYDALKCKPGNTVCGDRCLPKGQRCRSKGGALKKTAIGGAVLAAGLMAGTKTGRSSAREAAKSVKKGQVGKAAKQVATGLGRAADEPVTKAVQAAGKYVGKKGGQFAEAGLQGFKEKGEDIGREITRSGEAVVSGTVKEGKDIAKRKTSKLRAKLKRAKEIGDMPVGEAAKKVAKKVKKKIKKS